jgi:hypothetical protein
MGDLMKAIDGLIGQRVDRAWVLPAISALIVRFQNGYFLVVAYNVNDKEPIAIHIGTGINTQPLEREPQTPHTEELQGLRFRGLTINMATDRTVIDFDSVGVEFLQYGLHWVRRVPFSLN